MLSRKLHTLDGIMHRLKVSEAVIAVTLEIAAGIVFLNDFINIRYKKVDLKRKLSPGMTSSINLKFSTGNCKI